jgi:hypothetical protein
MSEVQETLRGIPIDPEGAFRIEMDDGSGFAGNGIRYATQEHAIAGAEELFSRWWGARQWRVMQRQRDPEFGSIEIEVARG